MTTAIDAANEAFAYGYTISWSPASISGLVTWYDFADASTLFIDAGTTNVTSDGDAIYQVNDKSSASHDAAQSTAGKRPTYKTNIANGHSVARFVGASSQFLVTGSYTWYANSTICIVASRTSNGSAQSLFDGDGIQRNFQTRYDSGADTVRQLTWAGVVQTTQTASAAGTKDVITFLRHGNTVGGDQVFVNGIGGTAADSQPATTTARVYSLGCTNADDAPPQGQHLTGDICEVVVYNVNLGTTDRQSVENYLKAKWGTP